MTTEQEEKAKERRERFPIRKSTNKEAMKEEILRHWQSRPASERFLATFQLTREIYKLKGIDVDKIKIDKTLIKIQRNW